MLRFTFCFVSGLRLTKILVRFDSLLDHLVRIARVLRQTSGHLLLCGSSGSGSSLISFNRCKLTYISIPSCEQKPYCHGSPAGSATWMFSRLSFTEIIRSAISWMICVDWWHRQFRSPSPLFLMNPMRSNLAFWNNSMNYLHVERCVRSRFLKLSIINFFNV